MKNMLCKIRYSLIAAMAMVFGLNYRPTDAYAGGVTPAAVTLRPFAYGAEDAALKVQTALPAAASTTVDSAAIDFYNDPSGFSPGRQFALQVRTPALTTTELPDTRTLTLTIMASAAADKSSPVAVSQPFVVTGAGGVGATAKAFDFGMPLNSKQYYFLRAVTGASTGDMSAKKSVLTAKF